MIIHLKILRASLFDNGKMLRLLFFPYNVDNEKMKSILYLFLLSFFLIPAGAETFRYQNDLWKNYKLITRTTEDVYLNDQFLQKGMVTSRASFTRMEGSGTPRYEAELMNLEEVHMRDQKILELSSEHRFEFTHDERGYMQVDPQYVYPVLRNLMVLPEGDVSAGDQWDEVGEEVHDLSRSYDVETLRFPRRVLYTYKGEVEYEDRQLHLIQTSSQFSVQPIYEYTPYGYFYPRQVTGYSTRKIYWDNELGRPVKVDETFNISFLLADLQTVVYTGYRESLYEYPELVNRQQEVEEVQEILEEQGISDTQVTGDEEGMILTMNRIHFAPDSYVILPDERQRLQTLADILARFPNRDIVISGHTADVGNPVFQQELSRDRAAAVAEILQQILGERPGLIITRGFGGTQPVAENDTELGRSQNRRVELKILDN